MEISNMKNIVVLKNLPSNMVEEAIVILKNNKKIKRPELIKKKKIEEINYNKNTEQVNSKDYIVKEAEMLICNYIAELENNNKTIKTQKNIQKKYNKIKKLNSILVVVSFISVLSFLLK